MPDNGALVAKIGKRASLAVVASEGPVTPAMAAGITDKLWSVEDIVVEASEPKSGKRRPYKKRAAA